MKFRHSDSSYTVECFDNGYSAVFPMAALSEGNVGFDCLTIRKVYKLADRDELMRDIDDFLLAETVEHYLDTN